MTTLKINFANPEAAHHFALWLCEAGEQDYWEWMRCQESEEDGEITAVSFDYFNNGKKFLQDFEINTNCGRLDAE